MFANIRVSQVVAAATFIVAVTLIIVIGIKKRAQNRIKKAAEYDDSLIIDIPTEDDEEWQ